MTHRCFRDKAELLEVDKELRDDNEWGYSNRVIDLIFLMVSKGL